MPKILLKRFDAPNQVPSINDLAVGELGVNTADGKVFLRRGVGTGLPSDTILDLADVRRNLGFTPLNQGGDTLTGTLVLAHGQLSSPPLRFQQGVVLATPLPHSLEWDGSRLYLTNNGSQRKTVAYTDSNITGSSAKWDTVRSLIFTGDVTGTLQVDGSSNVTGSLTAATVNTSPGVFGSSNSIPIITVNSKGLVTSVNTADISLTTTDVPEGTNRYFHESRARAAISVSGSLAYDPATGVISYVSPEVSPVASSGDYRDLTNKPVETSTTVIANTLTVEVDAFPSNSGRGAKFLVCVSDGFNESFHMTEMMVMHDDVDVYMIQYGVLVNQTELGEFSASIEDGDVVLFFTPINSTTKVVSVIKSIVPRV